MNEKINFEEKIETKEKLKEKPALTMYLLRHGQSEKDKTQIKRGLTEKGQKQVTETMQNVIKNLIQENNSNFNQWDDNDKIQEEVQKITDKTEFHLRDSGTERTIQQVWLEYDILKKYGIADQNIFLPKAVLEYKDQKSDQAGPGIAKRLKGVQGVDENPNFRLKLRDPEYRKKVKATGDLMAWVKTPENEIPAGIEKLSEMKTRYTKDINKAERVIKHLVENYEKKVIVIANSHASIATLAAAEEESMLIPKSDNLKEILNEVGEMPEAQGLKYDFYKGDKKHEARVFGKDIEEGISRIDARQIG